MIVVVSQLKNCLSPKNVFIYLKLAFTNIWIKIKAIYFLEKLSWNIQYKTYNTELLVLFLLLRFEGFLISCK